MDFTDPGLLLGFFRRLNELPERAPRRATAAAALITLREFGLRARMVPQTAQTVSRSRLAVDRLLAEAEPIAGYSASLHELLEGAASADSDTPVGPALGRLARTFELMAEWELATDVYRTLLAHVSPAADPACVAHAWLRLAYCARTTGNLDVAEKRYASGRMIAEAAGLEDAALRARVGNANVMLDRGNLPAAEAELEQVISAAEEASIQAAAAVAYHDRGHVAFRRGQVEAAIAYLYRAHERYEDPSKRDRVMADIGALLGELGYIEAARDAQMVVHATAIEQVSRWMAAVNLMAIAAREGERQAFEQYRRELAAASLPPLVEAEFQFELAAALRRDAEHGAARVAFQRSAEIAMAHQIHEVALRAETALNDPDTGRIAPARRGRSEFPDLEEVVSGIRRLRQSVLSA